MTGKDFLKIHVLSWQQKVYLEWEDVWLKKTITLHSSKYHKKSATSIVHKSFSRITAQAIKTSLEKPFTL